MANLPKSPEELLEIIKTPLDLFDRVGIKINVGSAISDIANRLPNDATGGVLPWLQGFFDQAQNITNGGDVLVLLWDLVKELMGVIVGLLGTFVDLLRSLIEKL
ncbi:MAG: hypothetical protein HYU81_00110 [Candidatus Brennerbacteria bacterium]|nr:hypothetical protein [Candidatus Brennerbacteria bacterium]